MEFVYTSKSPNLTATFAVIWGGSKPLDNPDNIHGKNAIFFLNAKHQTINESLISTQDIY